MKTLGKRLSEPGVGVAVMPHPAIPFFSPSTFIKAHPRRLVDCTALYAGENIAAITSLLGAGQIVEQLARGFD